VCATLRAAVGPQQHGPGQQRDEASRTAGSISQIEVKVIIADRLNAHNQS
jgi:hypothetical protein